MRNSPRPLLPRKRKSLNLASWFCMTATAFLSSAKGRSSLPADSTTLVPSGTGTRDTTRKGVGRDLLDRQCLGRLEHSRCGLPVTTRSPACSCRALRRVYSAASMMLSDIVVFSEILVKIYCAAQCISIYLRSLWVPLLLLRACVPRGNAGGWSGGGGVGGGGRGGGRRR